MSIIFQDKSNNDIDALVSLCNESKGDLNSCVLTTTPFDDIKDENIFDDDKFIEEVEDGPFNTPPDILAYPFTIPQTIIKDLIISIDSGIVHLGKLYGGGIAFAIRGASVCNSNGEMLVLRYHTGPLLITSQNKGKVFRFIGSRLGNPDLYVKNINGQLIPNPGVLDTVNEMQDRCRSYIERVIQEEALAVLSANHGGILLLDGALTISFDTPGNYLKALLQTASNNNVDVCAVSKRSRITIGGTPIDSLFDQYPKFVGYAKLLDALKKERAAYQTNNMRSPGEITAGHEVFAVRFGFMPPGVTFRVDVFRSLGHTTDDVINEVHNKCLIYGGYPRPLIDAHQYSCFQSSDKLSLLSEIAVQTGLRVKEEPSLEILFKPFGAFGK